MQENNPLLQPTLPDQMSVLLVCSPNCTSNWLAEALAKDSAVHVRLEDAANVGEAMARLRETVFDTVLIRHSLPDLNAIELLDSIRTTSRESQPMIVLGDLPENELLDECFEAGADAYVCINTSTTRSLIWKIARAIERHHLLAENNRLCRIEENRFGNEASDAMLTLETQQDIATNGAIEVEVPSEVFVSELRETLRTYVIMGSGNLRSEIEHLTGQAMKLGCLPRSVLMAMNAATEEVLRGLGKRSARHVMNRANLLLIELMTQLAEESGRAVS